MSNFEKIKGYLLELEHEVTQEHTEDNLLVINDENKGICNMMLDCEGDVLVVEQHIFDITNGDTSIFKRLLQMNRELVHGAFVLDEEGKRVLYRDTLEADNLDLNELEASLSALAIALVEHADEFLTFAAKETV
ncbi:MAG: YbjN domain-containing protein [Aureispira sp.]|nr:YbjN domain-containing protein [Aureispira sp.]